MEMDRIVDQLAAVLFGERMSNGYFSGQDARERGFAALANDTPSIHEQYRDKARQALDASGASEEITSLRQQLARVEAELDEWRLTAERFNSQRLRAESDLAAARAEVEELRATLAASDKITNDWIDRYESARSDAEAARELVRRIRGRKGE